MALEAIRSIGTTAMQAPAQTYSGQDVQKLAATGTDNERSEVQAQNASPSVSVYPKSQQMAEDPADELKIQEYDPEARAKHENEKIHNAIKDLNKKMISNTEAVFGYHDKTNRVTIKIVDKKTKEVIKELPPEKTLDLIAKAWEMAGILVDEKR